MTVNAGEVVKAAYNLLLNREPEPAGLQYWSRALEGGMSQVDFVRAVLTSPEFGHTPSSIGDVTHFNDVDLVIPVGDQQFRVPASDTSIVPHLLAQRCWEPHVMGFLTRQLRPDHVFVDVGANIGYFTVRCAPLVSRVIAFEPSAKSHRYSAMNIELNELSNVELRRCALWHEDATLQIASDASSLGSSTVGHVRGDVTVESTEGVSLDALVRRGGIDLPRLDVMKMDIEGAEVSALLGMRGTLERLRPVIVMEINRPALSAFESTVDEVWTLLDEMAYRVLAFDQWKEREPIPVETLDDLKRLCPPDCLLDIVAAPCAR
jgi:FkbM family methyltransferase